MNNKTLAAATVWILVPPDRVAVCVSRSIVPVPASAAVLSVVATAITLAVVT